MDLLTLFCGLSLILCGTFDMVAVFSRDVMMLQQNSYRNERYSRWFSQSGESTNLGRIFCCIALLFILVHHIPLFASSVIAAIIVLAQGINLFRKKYKKPLVWTPRARRIFGVMVAITAIAVALFWVFLGLKAGCAALTATLVISPIVLLAANDLLRPVEKHINQGYLNEALDILRSKPDLKIIGITGSYGKTSTKHYLKRILDEAFAVAMTPGSFNTPLGVIRTVREHLRPYDEVFIVEMGAKQPGDIKEICDIVHPTMGIITAVGEQHLESFKSIQNVQATKFELADALPPDGFVVVNNDFEWAARREVKNTRVLRYSTNPEAKTDFHATDIRYSANGTDFKIDGPGLTEPLALHTPLVGSCNVSNLLAAVIVALKLGVAPEKIRYAVEQIEPVEHRLSMKRTPGGLTIIDDAFNSNPAGAAMALEVLKMMTGGRRIIITPGMIELGERQYEANRKFGKEIPGCADVAIVVGNYNRDAICEGLLDGGMAENTIITVDTFAEAQQHLTAMMRPGDTVLYENDLPDLFK